MSDLWCPYCSNKMHNGPLMWGIKQISNQVVCKNCGARGPEVIVPREPGSPYYIDDTRREELKQAARVMAEGVHIAYVLSFDECMVYGDTEQQTDMIPDPVWLEYRDPDGWTGWVCLEDHVYHPPEDSRGRGLYIMHPGCDVDGNSEYEANYGKTWRCWSRRPTDQEKAEAEWNG